jgi:hypothetical protein
MSPKNNPETGEPERLSALISGVLGARFLLAVFCIGGTQKSVQPGFRATRPLDEFNFYFADATLFLMGKYALGPPRSSLPTLAV